jgi:hypothetical protein
VLIDGAAEGERVVGNRTYPVFNVLQRLVAAPYRTFVIELATSDLTVVSVLEECADQAGGAAEDWGTTTRILCHACSVGIVHQHVEGDAGPAHPHCGLASRDNDHAHTIISAWLAKAPRADMIVWFEAPDAV